MLELRTENRLKFMREHLKETLNSRKHQYYFLITYTPTAISIFRWFIPINFNLFPIKCTFSTRVVISTQNITSYRYSIQTCAAQTSLHRCFLCCFTFVFMIVTEFASRHLHFENSIKEIIRRWFGVYIFQNCNDYANCFFYFSR